MGSLISRPKSPAVQTVYVPQSAPVVTEAAVEATATEAAPDPAQEAAAARKKSLLARERGRFGTVQTGFRGLLALTQNNQQRKTLLGE